MQQQESRGSEKQGKADEGSLGGGGDGRVLRKGLMREKMRTERLMRYFNDTRRRGEEADRRQAYTQFKNTPKRVSALFTAKKSLNFPSGFSTIASRAHPGRLSSARTCAGPCFLLDSSTNRSSSERPSRDATSNDITPEDHPIITLSGAVPVGSAMWLSTVCAAVC